MKNSSNSPNLSTPEPPVAKKTAHLSRHHGDVLQDDYHWMCNRNDSGVMDYIKEENAYTASIMKDASGLEESLYKEIVGRIKETDSSVPIPWRGFFYYSRTEEGRQYRIYCRKKGSLECPEEILLDLNQEALGHSFCTLGSYAVSPDGSRLLYSLDYEGDESFTIFVRNLDSGELFPDRLEKTTGQCLWAADGCTIFYTTFDHTRRADRLFRHRMGEHREKDCQIFHEADETFCLSIGKSRSERFIFLVIASHNSSETHFIESAQPEGALTIIAPRRRAIEYYVEHHQDRFIIRTNEKAENFRLMETPVDAPARKNWKELLPHRESVLVEDIDAFKDYLVIHEKEKGLKKLRIRKVPEGKEHYVSLPEPVYDIIPEGNREYDTGIFRFAYESLVTPCSVFDYDMETRMRVLLKEDEIKGYARKDFICTRIYAPSKDGTAVPISLVHRKGLSRDGSHPLYLAGYGAYGIGYDASFSPHRISLLERGFTFAIAHIRGGDDLGRKWYKNGKLLKKKNSFHDFIASAEHLIKEGYTSRDSLVISGRSAGGLLIGSVVTMRPDICHIAVAGVPFVDALNTMLDPSLPLTIGEYGEWGNPQMKTYYRYIKSYSPYDNIKRREYPHMLVLTALNDTRVMFWEPLKWTAKLRAMKTDSNVLLLKTNLEAGHRGASGRYDLMKETAFEYAFILKMTGITA